MSPRAYLRDSVAASKAVDAFLAELGGLDDPITKKVALAAAPRLQTRLGEVELWVGRIRAARPDDSRLVDQRDALQPELDAVVTQMDAVVSAAQQGRATELVALTTGLNTAVATLRAAAAG